MSRCRIEQVCVEDVEKRRHPSKHYVFVIRVTWSDGNEQIIYRRYSQFFDLQCHLLDEFPDDAGEIYPTDRIIPFLPGKILFGRSHIREVALKRLDPINDYCKDLIKLPSHISECEEVLSFFETRPEDLNPQRDPPSKKKNDQSPIKEISDPTSGEQYIAVADYAAGAQKKGNVSHDVSLTAGENVDVLEKNEKGWWFVSCEEGQGWVPSSFLERADGQEESREVQNESLDCMYVCVHDCHPQYEDELLLRKGYTVKVVEKNLDGWWLAEYEGSTGRVPACYLSPADSLRVKQMAKKTEEKAQSPAVEIVPSLAVISDKHKNSGPLPPHVASRMQTHVREPDNHDEHKEKSLMSILRHPFSRVKLDWSDEENYPDESTPKAVRKSGPPPRHSTIRRSVWLVDGQVQGAVKQEETIYQAVTTFNGQNISGGTSVNEEDIIKVIEKSESGWWYVQTPSHTEGWIPSNVIQKKLKSQVTSPKPKPQPRKIPPPRPGALPSKPVAESTDIKTELANKFSKFVTKMSPTASPRTSRKNAVTKSADNSPRPSKRTWEPGRSFDYVDGDTDEEGYFSVNDYNAPEEEEMYVNHDFSPREPAKPSVVPPKPPSAHLKPSSEPPKPPSAALKPTKKPSNNKPNISPPKPPIKPNAEPPKPPPVKPSAGPPKPPSAALKPNIAPPIPPSSALKPRENIPHYTKPLSPNMRPKFNTAEKPTACVKPVAESRKPVLSPKPARRVTDEKPTPQSFPVKLKPVASNRPKVTPSLPSKPVNAAQKKFPENQKVNDVNDNSTSFKNLRSRFEQVN